MHLLHFQKNSAIYYKGWGFESESSGKEPPPRFPPPKQET